jgi:membrane protein
MATTTWNRGREANSPHQIPSTGWKDTLYRVKDGLKLDHISMVSAATSYYALFALVPAITSVVLIYAWISDPADISQHISMVSNFMPEEARSLLETQLSSLAGQAGGVGLGAILSILIALWSASKGTKAFMEAMNIIYNEREERGVIKYNALGLGLTLLAIVFSLLAIAVIIGIPAIAGQLNIGGAFQTIVTVVSWVVLLALFSLFLSCIYRFGPNRNEAKWKWVSWGAVIAAVLWAGASALFSWYASKYGDFNKTYGSLGAVIVLMTWFYLSSFVILLGGEINAELEHQTAKDTTRGKVKPMGKRDAHVADTVGEAHTKRKKQQ